MGMAQKLNLGGGMKLHVVGKPADVDLDNVGTTTSAESADGTLVFVTKLAEVDATCAPMVAASKADRLAWVAYPKAGKLGTDLNRDILWKHVRQHGIDGVRQVAIDETWSAMRFRPGKPPAG